MCDCGCDITIPTGSRGPQGIQGIQGPIGPKGDTGNTGSTGASGGNGSDGEDAYVYIAYAENAFGVGFSNTFDPNLNWIAVLSTNYYIGTPSVDQFVGLWKNYKGAVGNTGPAGPKGVKGDQGVQGLTGLTGANGVNGAGLDTTFGVIDPSGVPATNPAIYINTDTFDVWRYTGTWGKIIQGYETWQNVTTYNTFQGWQNSSTPLKYRREGKNVRVIGVTSNSTPFSLVTSQVIFTLPVGYRPPSIIFQTAVDPATPLITIIEISTSGNVYCRGDLVAFDTESGYFNFTFPLA